MHISLDSALGRQRRLNSVGESVLQIAPDAAAAYSLRSLTGGDPDVVRVRRESDNTEKDFSGSQIESGEMARWVNEQPTLPLDLRELDENTGERDGALIEAAAAYSLRKLKKDFTGDVVEVRRNVDGETEGFTADEVTDGTLESFVNASFDDELPLDQATGAAAAYSLRNLKASGTDVTTSGDTAGDTTGKYVVQVRRSSDDAVKSFTAAEVADGTLEDWVTPDALSGFYNNRAYFGAGNSGDYVRLLNVGNFGTQDWQWKLKFFLTDEPQFKGLITRNDQDPIIGVKANGQLQYYYEDINGNTQNSSLFPDGSINQLVEYTLTLDYDLSAKTMSVTLVGSDGTSVNGTLNNVYHNDAPAAINIGTNSNRTFSTGGSVYDVEIRQSGVLTNSYAGYGNTDADWLDLTGSINGEVFGSPELFTGQGINGHVKTWYDQSGSDNHATQTDTAKQPKIVDAGSLVSGGVDFDGVDDGFSIDFGADLTQANSLFLVHQSDTLTDTSNEFFDSAGSQPPRTLFDQSGTNYRLFCGTSADTGVALTNDQSLVSVIFNGASSLFAKNGTATGALNPGTTAINQNSTLGFSSERKYDGTMKEFILYNSDQSTKRRAIEENIANHYDISLAAFSRDGTVSTWYDQSGNTNDATQTDPAKQPKIVIDGDLVTGGIDFNGAEFLSRSSFTQGDLEQPNTTFSVAKLDSNDDTNRKVYDGETGNGRNMLFLSQQDSGQFGIYSGSTLLTGDLATSDKHLFTALYNSTSSEFFIDGTSEASGDAGVYSMDAIVIGANHDEASNFWLGQIQEIIIYNSDQTDNRTAIEANIGETYGITAIPAANDTVNGYVQTWYDQSGGPAADPENITGFTITGSGANATYTIDSPSQGDKISFTGGSYNIRFTSGQWRIYDGGDLLHYSAEDVNYPWDVTNWTTTSDGSGTPAFGSFVGGSTTPYPANDATQSTAANQPKIVGEVTSGEPHAFLGAIDFDGTNDFLETNNSDLCNISELSLFTALTAVTPASRDIAVSAGSVVFGSTSYGGWELAFESSSGARLMTQSLGSSDVSSANQSVSAGERLVTSILNVPNGTTSVDGAEGTTNTGMIEPYNNGTGKRKLRIGCQYTFQASRHYSAPIKEVILYDSDQSSNRTAIETNIADEYGITLS